MGTTSDQITKLFKQSKGSSADLPSWSKHLSEDLSFINQNLFALPPLQDIHRVSLCGSIDNEDISVQVC